MTLSIETSPILETIPIDTSNNHLGLSTDSQQQQSHWSGNPFLGKNLSDLKTSNFHSNKPLKSSSSWSRWTTWWTIHDSQNILLLFLVTLAFRLFIIYHPSVVVFDEVHFGGFASNYLNHNYYLDVHPPLAKMLIALTAWLGGIDYTYRFDAIGLDYLETKVPYIFMRSVPALLGALMVPFAYIISRSLNLGTRGALWTASLVLFDNFFTTQFRFILLDAYLAFGTAAAALSYVCFLNRAEEPFSLSWWTFLAATGLALGFTVSCKWVGLFTIATIGLFTVLELWQLWADRNQSYKRLTGHFFARAGCLIFVPAFVYIASFYVHIELLSNYGLAGSTMSLEFQQDLKGGTYPPVPSEVYYGSVIGLRHKKKGGYLHSHPAAYVTGSKQQQVTMYPYLDGNSKWRILPRTQFLADGDYVNRITTNLIPLRHGDKIRLAHVGTNRFLHSHNVVPPISNKENNFEVSGYGVVSESIGDTNDDWVVLIVDKDGKDINFDGIEENQAREQGIIASYLDFPIYTEKKKQDEQISPEKDHAKNQIEHGENVDVPTGDNDQANEELQVEKENHKIAQDLGSENAEQDPLKIPEEKAPVDPEKAAADAMAEIEALQRSARPIAKFGESALNDDSPVQIYPEIKARETFIKFIHPNTHCHLSTFSKKLPAWAFEQGEVTCGRDTLKNHAVWTIDSNHHPLFDDDQGKLHLEKMQKANYGRIGFWEKFIELNVLMWKVNAALTGEHYFGSRPWSWPWLSRGLGFFNGAQQGQSRNFTLVFAEDHQKIIDSEFQEMMAKSNGNLSPDSKPKAVPKFDAQGNEVKQQVWKSGSFTESPKLKSRHASNQIYLMGNPLVWWSVTASIILYTIFLGLLYIWEYRYGPTNRISATYRITGFAGFLFSAYLIHYIPFYFMGRQLFLHHYVPSYYFGILLTGVLVEGVATKLESRFPSWFRRDYLYIASMAVIVYVYLLFAPLSYGLPMTQEKCLSIKWLPGWDFDCNIYPNEVLPAITDSIKNNNVLLTN